MTCTWHNRTCIGEQMTGDVFTFYEKPAPDWVPFEACTQYLLHCFLGQVPSSIPYLHQNTQHCITTCLHVTSLLIGWQELTNIELPMRWNEQVETFDMSSISSHDDTSGELWWREPKRIQWRFVKLEFCVNPDTNIFKHQLSLALNLLRSNLTHFFL